MKLGPARAQTLVDALDLRLHDTGICYACLSFVSFAIDEGDEQKVRSELLDMAGPLWNEGLALPTRAALERARRAGVPDAVPAIAEIERHGHRSAVVRAVVRRLAGELLAEMRLPPHAEVVPIRP